jgi:predicted SprT family Zn-dependent metalloprotease
MKISDCHDLARELMRQHGLVHWSLKFDESKRRFGQCRMRDQVISLSWRLVDLNDEATVKDTILHEIAHALTPRAGHGWKWRAKALEIGCDGKRCYSADTVKTPPKKFVGTCPKCLREIKRHKRTKISCGKCDRKFNKDLLFTWTICD